MRGWTAARITNVAELKTEPQWLKLKADSLHAQSYTQTEICQTGCMHVQRQKTECWQRTEKLMADNKSDENWDSFFSQNSGELKTGIVMVDSELKTDGRQINDSTENWWTTESWGSIFDTK